MESSNDHQLIRSLQNEQLYEALQVILTLQLRMLKEVHFMP